MAETILGLPRLLKSVLNADGSYTVVVTNSGEPGDEVILGNFQHLRATKHSDGSHSIHVKLDGGAAQGSVGFTGSRGFNGSQGAVGFTGSQGFTGSIGFTGSVGFTGSRGFNGSAGFTGSQGSTPALATTATYLAGTNTGQALGVKNTWDAHSMIVLTPVSNIATPDLNLGINFSLTISANTTLADPVNPKLGQSFSVTLTRPALETLSFGSSYRAYENIDLPATTAKGAKIICQVRQLSPLLIDLSVIKEI